MALAARWFWNLGFLGFLYGFCLPIDLLVNMRMLKVLFRHSETTHKLDNMYMA